MNSFLSTQIEQALAVGPPGAPPPVGLRVVGRGSLPSCFDVTGLAVASLGAAARELVRLEEADRGADACVEVDRRLASLWFGFSLRPLGWSLPSPWDPIAGDYATRDGWIKLHTNAPHHRDAALAVLGVAADRAAVAAAVETWAAEALETAIVEQGGCAAALRTASEWAVHPQGLAVAREPLVAWQAERCPPGRNGRPEPGRPLAGLRVLDLTRVLAGPVATRFLAAFGAEVLRIDPPAWDEPGVVPEVTVGKRCAGLDLKRSADRGRFEALLAGADVLVHGYRGGALDRLGFPADRIRTLNPRIVDVSLRAYGHEGPWRQRRGFDSLVQMSCGIAEEGMQWAGSPQPKPLPVQALDHATGYLMAAAVLRGLRLRRDEGLAAIARLSLARTAALLAAAPPEPAGEPFDPLAASDVAPEIESTRWGPAQRIRFPVRIPGAEPGFDRPACELRSSAPDWGGGGKAPGV